MSLKRRHFLLFLAAGFGAAACGQVPQGNKPSTSPVSGITDPVTKATDVVDRIGFQPIKGPMPLDSVSNAAKQLEDFSTYEVVDDLVLPEGYTYDVIASWGDKVGDSRFGYNNDYIAFIPVNEDEAYLAINFEYISSSTWLQTYEKVIGKPLPLSVQHVITQATDVSALPDDSPLKKDIQMVCREALIDLGIGVIGISRDNDGKWKRNFSPADRRITGISGLEDDRYLKVTGPAAAVFRKTTGKGYTDKLGDKIIGTFQNCAGGTTPWGTMLSGEENFQDQVPEAVYADGTSFDPKTSPFLPKSMGGPASVFGLAGNKYGWIVEVDPADAADYGTKHTWLGRYRHEAVGVRVEAGKPLAFYSGCDRRGGHLYKFVSKNNVTDPQDKSNSKLLAEGMLYVAKFNPDGTGKWMALNPKAQIDPTMPDQIHARAGDRGVIGLPQRPQGGILWTSSKAQVERYKAKYKTLADLYEGNDEEKQGAILIDAHYAANAIGATLTARPEDTEIAPDGALFIAFTSGSADDEGGPDKTIFKGKDGLAYEYGWVMRLEEEGGEPGAMNFRWEMAATGGEPAEGGQGFSNPDNLVFDPKGNLWMVTDMSTGRQNQAVEKGRLDQKGEPLSQTSLVGLFGNNSIWMIPTQGENAGEAFLFGMGPMETETTGPCFSADGKYLFAAIQHPGEANGIRRNMASESRLFEMRTPDGQTFMQKRMVPIGSNWPSLQANDPPKPSVVVIRRTDDRAISL